MKAITDYIKYLFPEASDDRLLTVLVTLGVFFAGFLIRGINNYFNAQIRKKQVRNDVRSILHEVIESIDSQARNFKLFISESNVDSPIWTMTHVLMPLDRINQYGYKEISRAFITSRHFWRKKKARRSINECFKFFDLVRNVESEYRSFFKEMNDLYIKHQKIWNALNKEQGAAFDNLAIELNDLAADGYLNEQQIELRNDVISVMNIRNNWVSLPNRLVPSILNESLINPAFEVFRGSQMRHPQLRKAVGALRDSKYEYDSMVNVTNKLKEGIEHYRDKYNETYRVLTKSYVYSSTY